VKDDGVESSRRCCALMIELVGMSERRLGHNQPRDQCPPATSSTYSAPDQGARSNRNEGLDPIPLDARWVNSTFSPLTST
jgi:hypothetical protein